MPRHLEITIGLTALLTSLIGGTVVVENRYAKAQEVQSQLNSYWARSLKLRLLELQLKPAPLSTNERVLMETIQQELREVTPALAPR